MMTRRWVPLLAAILLVLVTGGSSRGAVQLPDQRQITAVASGGGAGAMSAAPDTPAPSLVAADISRPLTMSRPENQQTARLLTIVLVTAALLAAARTRRSPVLRRLLELSIRSQTDWWRPTPGGRAPPPLTL